MGNRAARLAGLTLLLTAAGGARAAADVAAMGIEDPRRHWSMGGYVALVPSIHLPTTHGADDLIQVWLKLPDDGSIDARPLPEQERHTLVYPPGTQTDRVEYRRRSETELERLAHYAPLTQEGPTDPAWTVMDVRGLRVDAEGRARFHVLRPTSGEPHAPLEGWSWLRGDAQAQAEATRRLTALARQAGRPVGRPPLEGTGLRELARLNDCAGCHQRNEPRVLFPEGGELTRATDSLGLFVPIEVFRDDCIVASHRPEDINANDPFVEVRCGDASARLRSDDGSEYYVCDGDREPMGHRDVRAGLAADHPYTEAMCESRRRLFARMTTAAREAFADAARACGIAVP